MARGIRGSRRRDFGDNDRVSLEKIVEARMKLMARFKAKMTTSPAQADARPLGSGAINRHGMPKLPIGQSETEKWPVLDLGEHPRIAPEGWQLTVDGAVAHPTTFSWAEFMALEQVEDVSDFHCVTAWSRMDLRWLGVRVSTVLAIAEPDDRATHLMCHAYDGYSTNVALEEALKDDVLLVHTVDGSPLPREHGGPVRMITPELYAWKGAKWVNRLEVMIGDRPGFWEERGYSNTAHPWRNDRYG
jgi:DMSO/TMAO reductase YedYZ molybdopterin-dependent catalytic subunit